MPAPSARARRGGTRGPANAEALLAAAHRLVRERGENFTTQDLVKEADVALQTFYRHFGGKDQLLLAVVADMIGGHCRALALQGAGVADPVERLRFYITSTLSALEVPSGKLTRFITSQHWRLHQLHPSELAAATKPFADLVQVVLEDGRASGVLHPRDPERDAWLVNKLVMAAFHHYAFDDGDPAAATVAEDVWAFCLAAVGGGAPATATRPRVTPAG